MAHLLIVMFYTITNITSK